MTSRYVVWAISLSSVLALAACGSKDRPVGPAENLPNAMVPTSDTALNYGADESSQNPVAPSAPTGSSALVTDADLDPANESDDALAERLGVKMNETLTRSTKTAERELHEKAEFLGRLPKDLYLEFQKKIVGSVQPACNFFVITALCESGYCEKKKPFYRAAEFDDYFFANGWVLSDLAELKKMFENREVFDSVLQKDNPVAGRPGHILIPIGINPKGVTVIAQGNLNTVTNEVKTATDSFLTSWQGGFKVFIKR